MNGTTYITGRFAPLFKGVVVPHLRRDTRTDMVINGAITHSTLPVH